MPDPQLIYNCPGCGKPTPAPQGALTNRCQFCGLVVRLGAPGVILKYFYPSRIDSFGARMAADRFLKENNMVLTTNVIRSDFYYVPFYRFRGMALDYVSLSVMEQKPIESMEEAEDSISFSSKLQLKAKDFDITIPAISEMGFGLTSLGIRPAAVPLYSFCPADIPAGAKVINANTDRADVPRLAQNLHNANTNLYIKGKVLYSAMIGEQISLIYFPIWALIHQQGERQKTIFVDALARRAYAQIDYAFEFGDNPRPAVEPIMIVPSRHQCPNCGADLDDKPFSLYYPCKNCKRAYMLIQGGYQQIAPKIANSSKIAPFWRFPLELKGQKTYKTVMDFSKLLVSELSFLRKEKRDNQFYLYSPAFYAADATRWVEMALRVLKSQPHDQLVERIPLAGPDPAIEQNEGKQMASFLWNVAVARYQKIQKAGFSVDEFSLPDGEIVWLPLEDENLLSKSRDYRQVNVVSK
jgi:DNA-directed RNA polymerase subunit RPC12/RpoP